LALAPGDVALGVCGCLEVLDRFLGPFVIEFCKCHHWPPPVAWLEMNMSAVQSIVRYCS
jgi:hypothetical protein